MITAILIIIIIVQLALIPPLVLFAVVSWNLYLTERQNHLDSNRDKDKLADMVTQLSFLIAKAWVNRLP